HNHEHKHDQNLSKNSLFNAIDKINISTLNESIIDSSKSVFKPWHERFDYGEVESNEDIPELLMFVPFCQVVDVHSIAIVSKDARFCPVVAKIWSNKREISTFECVENRESDQKIDLMEDQNGEIHYSLNRSKFLNVERLAIYFASEEKSKIAINHIELRGKIKMAKSRAVKTVYEVNRSGSKGLISNAENKFLVH
ncbi:hypothetical protein MHBO_004897, partial [Bonamia ostreae]